MISEAGLYEKPDEWVWNVLSSGERRLPAPPFVVYDWLRIQFENDPEARFSKAVTTGIVEIVANLDSRIRESPQAAGPVIALALDLIGIERITPAVDPLKVAVHRRLLDRVIGTYTDLHGRALLALYRLDALDPVSTWRAEVEYQRFAPLVFAFLRDTSPNQLPVLMTEAARLGFMPEAIQSIADELSVTSRDSRGFQILLSSGKMLRDSRDPTVVAEFCEEVRRLEIAPDLMLELLMAANQRFASVIISCEFTNNALSRIVLGMIGVRGAQVTTEPVISWKSDPGMRYLVITDSDSTATDFLSQNTLDGLVLLVLAPSVTPRVDERPRLRLITLAESEYANPLSLVEEVIRLVPIVATIDSSVGHEEPLYGQRFRTSDEPRAQMALPPSSLLRITR